MAREHPLSLENILSKAGLTHEQLNSSIEQHQHFELADLLGNCDLYLDQLDFSLSPSDKVNIKGQPTNQDKVRMFLSIWRDKMSYKCTYKMLIEVLLRLEQGETAYRVATFLSKSAYILCML